MLSQLAQIIASLFALAGEALASHGGRIALMDTVIISGIAGDKVGMPWAPHLTIATLAVVLVELGQPQCASHGSRLASLVALMLIGGLGAYLHVQSGEQVLLSAFAVLLVVIQDGRDSRGGADKNA